jgi:hypothetical protein
MKVKVQFIAEREVTKNENGKEVTKIEKIKDAIQAYDLDGKKLAIGEFGHNIGNLFAGNKLPDNAKDDILGFEKFYKTLYNNDGEEIEFDEKYIPILNELVERTQPTLTVVAVKRMLDEALVQAKNDSEAKKVEKKLIPKK